MGTLTLMATPASIDAGLRDDHLATLWSLTLVAAGAVCLVGAACRAPLVEVAGCTMAGAAFATWASAATTQDHPTTTSWVIAVLLISGVCGQVYRGAEIVKDARPTIWPDHPAEGEGR
ncbi:hypothetical protein K8Z61_18615 [Nocardioides sp. TRM66260-LWL]|uniref:hypothetical protein n=1 Tax=Nocardioides sp. TRM66260-LWL TaxID=2874478 RepID=UPI001CC805D1|nr:hypothetical protein [Nocardioides sp. TRM66260-LWL]MBZ5736509.1 hypothetical protein [Nocardioides sp. TRM66260-LWL]